MISMVDTEIQKLIENVVVNISQVDKNLTKFVNKLAEKSKKNESEALALHILAISTLVLAFGKKPTKEYVKKLRGIGKMDPVDLVLSHLLSYFRDENMDKITKIVSDSIKLRAGKKGKEDNMR